MKRSPLDVLEADGGWLTADGVAAETDMTDEAIRRSLHRAKAEGKVETRIVDGKNEWRLTTDGSKIVRRENEPPRLKVCSRCRQGKPPSEFNRNRSSADGLTHYCKACIKARYQERKTGKAEPQQPSPSKAVRSSVNGWRGVFRNPSLDQLKQLRDLVGVSSLDEAAAICEAIAGESE